MGGVESILRLGSSPKSSPTHLACRSSLVITYTAMSRGERVHGNDHHGARMADNFLTSEGDRMKQVVILMVVAVLFVGSCGTQGVGEMSVSRR